MWGWFIREVAVHTSRAEPLDFPKPISFIRASPIRTLFFHFMLTWYEGPWRHSRVWWFQWLRECQGCFSDGNAGPWNGALSVSAMRTRMKTGLLAPARHSRNKQQCTNPSSALHLRLVSNGSHAQSSKLHIHKTISLTQRSSTLQ
jgi:hypothetical protein